MNETIPGFTFGDAKNALRNLENRWMNERTEEIIYSRFAEIEEKEERKRERLSKYLTADELCRQSGLTKD